MQTQPSSLFDLKESIENKGENNQLAISIKDIKLQTDYHCKMDKLVRTAKYVK